MRSAKVFFEAGVKGASSFTDAELSGFRIATNENVPLAEFMYLV